MKFINEKLHHSVLMFKSNPSLIGGLFLASFLTFFLIGNKSLFLDEAASYLITREFSSMFYIFWHFEGNMWFYYILLHFWSYLGTSETILRSLSAIFAILTVIPTYFLAKELFDKRVASIAMVLLPINLLFIKNAQFARGYSLIILLTTISTLFLVKYLHKPTRTRLIIYILTSVLAVYTHLFAVLVIGSHFIYLVLLKKKRILNYLKAYLFIGLAILPLLLAPSLKSGQTNWIPMPGVKELLGVFYFLLGDFWPLSLIFIIITLWYIISKKYHSNDKSSFLIFLLTFPILFAFIFSLFAKPIFAVQYFSICLIPLNLLFSATISSINYKMLRYLLIIILILSVIRINSWYLNKNDFSNTIPNQNPDWRSTALYITQNANSKDIIILLPPYMQIPYEYYKIQTDIKQPKILSIHTTNFITLQPSKKNYDILSRLKIKNSRIWLIEDTNYINNSELKTNIDITLNSYKLTKIKKYTKIQITLYEN